MSWKPEVFVEGRWSQNQLVFATEAEAKLSAADLHMRWTTTEDSRAVEVDLPVTARIVNGELELLNEVSIALRGLARNGQTGEDPDGRS